jgi:hypothetical protein
MPMMILFLVITSLTNEVAKNLITIAMILALLAVSVEALFISRKATATIREKLGSETKLQRGNYFYILTRGMQPRPLRLPKPAPRKKNKA